MAPNVDRRLRSMFGRSDPQTLQQIAGSRKECRNPATGGRHRQAGHRECQEGDCDRRSDGGTLSPRNRPSPSSNASKPSPERGRIHQVRSSLDGEPRARRKRRPVSNGAGAHPRTEPLPADGVGPLEASESRQSIGPDLDRQGSLHRLCSPPRQGHRQATRVPERQTCPALSLCLGRD